jgi:membrane-associated protein
MALLSLAATFIDYFLHLDQYLNVAIDNYGIWIYLILFLIVFCETGLVVTPFLPGDSLLFAAGTFAAIGSLNVVTLFALFGFASILGDMTNYGVGNYLGPKVFKKKSMLFKQEYLHKTSAFYRKYGRKTIVIARFMPIVRTFAPFVAGVCKMDYPSFMVFNIIGGILWSGLFVFGGYLFGNISFVKENFEWVILAIIFLSIMPGIIEYIRSKRKK